MDPPESTSPWLAPEEAARRLELIREQYRHGLVDRSTFEQGLRELQFTDEADEIWTIGARSGRWYRWSGRAWASGTPPPRLFLPAASEHPTATAPGSGRVVDFPRPATPAAADPPAAGSDACPGCGVPIRPGKRFCTSCGHSL
jgi:hypothetical protein